MWEEVETGPVWVVPYPALEAPHTAAQTLYNAAARQLLGTQARLAMVLMVLCGALVLPCPNVACGGASPHSCTIAVVPPPMHSSKG